MKFVTDYSPEYAEALEKMPTKTPKQRITLLNQIVKARETAASYDSATRQFELTEADRGFPDVSGIVFSQDSHSDFVGISADKRDELSSRLDEDLMSQKAELESSEPEQEDKIRDAIGNTMARQALLNNNGDFNAARDSLTAAKGDSSEVKNLDSAIEQLDQIQAKEMKRQTHTTRVLDEIFNTETSYFDQVFSLTEKAWGSPPDTTSMNIFERMEHDNLVSAAESKLLQAHWDEITEQSARTLCDLAGTTYNEELRPEFNVVDARGKHQTLTPEQKLKGQVYAMRTERQKTILMQMSTASIKQKQSGEILERVGQGKKGATLIQAFSELPSNRGMNPNAKIIGPTQRGPRYKLLSDEIKKVSPENAKELLNNQNENLVSNMKIFNSFIPG